MASSKSLSIGWVSDHGGESNPGPRLLAVTFDNSATDLTSPSVLSFQR